jgi:hypothetical protein
MQISPDAALGLDHGAEAAQEPARAQTAPSARWQLVLAIHTVEVR